MSREQTGAEEARGLRILYLSPRECWPLTTGARLRDFHLARELARKAAVSYFGLRLPGDQPAEVPGAAGFVRTIVAQREPAYTPGKLLRGFVGPRPVTILNYFSRDAARLLHDTLAKGRFDTVQIEGVHLLSYLPVIRSAAPQAAVLADWHNIESEIMLRYAGTAGNPGRRLFARRTAALIRRAEADLLDGCDAHTVASDRERATLSELRPGAFVATVPNGVDVERFAVVSNGGEAATSIVFVGSMDYHANIDGVLWFAREVWPRIRATGLRLRFVIVGRDPAPDIRALAAEDIAITGTVEDVRPYYQEARMVVVPLRVGSGTRLKILEAMAAGIPVISTSLGAEGLCVSDGLNIRIADTVGEFAAAVGELAASPELRGRLANGGRKLVRERYDWPVVGEALYAIHEQLAAARVRAS